jgi:hypothetical protein
LVNLRALARIVGTNTSKHTQPHPRRSHSELIFQQSNMHDIVFSTIVSISLLRPLSPSSPALDVARPRQYVWIYQILEPAVDIYLPELHCREAIRLDFAWLREEVSLVSTMAADVPCPPARPRQIKRIVFVPGRASRSSALSMRGSVASGMNLAHPIGRGRPEIVPSSRAMVLEEHETGAKMQPSVSSE